MEQIAIKYVQNKLFLVQNYIFRIDYDWIVHVDKPNQSKVTWGQEKGLLAQLRVIFVVGTYNLYAKDGWGFKVRSNGVYQIVNNVSAKWHMIVVDSKFSFKFIANHNNNFWNS